VVINPAAKQVSSDSQQYRWIALKVAPVGLKIGTACPAFAGMTTSGI
jgi:hypothetical protein